MSRTATLLQLRTDIRVQSDLVGASVRHDDTILNRLINQSIQGFREAITNEGSTHFLVPYSGTLTAGATSPYSFGSLDLSAISPSIVRTYGLDITVDNVVRTLDHRPFTERNIWAGPATTGIPRHWAHHQTAKLAIQPAPNSAYPYTLWYLPVLADLSGDSDTFDGVAGWEEWVVWDVVCKLLIRDQQSAAFASAKLYKDETWSRIHRQATRVSSAGGAVVGRDTLRGRIPDPLVGRGPVMAGGGLPQAHSVTLAMLAEVAGPVFLGRQLSSTGDVQAMTPATAASILPTFTPSAAGLVPAAGGSSTTKFLSQAGTFETVTGGGGGSPGGPTGSIQINGLSGFVGLTGFAVQGSPPSMTFRVPGSIRITGGSVDVGSGTVRMSASGLDMGGGQLANVSSLFAFPTFAAGVPGLVPASDNDSSKFLNAAGGFAVPPGTAGSAAGDTGYVQYRDALGGFQGASGVRVVASGAALMLGASGANTGLLRLGDSFQFVARNQSGVAVNLIQNVSNVGSGGYVFGSSAVGLNLQRAEELFRWELNGVSGTSMALTATGLALPQYNIAVGSITVGSGIANSQLATVPSGTVKASLTNATPSDIVIPTLAAFFPTFTANRAGLVPTSDGDSSKFLNAVGGFAVPPGLGGSSPTGVLNSQLADMPSGTVKARLTGTGAVQDVLIPSLFMYAPTMTAARAGIVGPGGGDPLSFLRGDGQFAAPTGFVWNPTGLPNANLAVMPSGTVKANLAGTGAPADVLIPTLFMYAPTMTSARAGIVGPGGGSLQNFLRGDGAFAAPTGFFSTPTGLMNANLAPMPSGTVKANLSGTAVPSDLIIPTLMAFFPTFTSGKVGLVPNTSDGDSGKYLNAAGGFTTPVAAATPGGDTGNVQWNNGGAMAGASGIHATGGGAFLALGPQAQVANNGDLRVASGFSIQGRNASGIAQPILDFWAVTGTVRFGSSGLARISNDVASGGSQQFTFGGVTATTLSLLPTGIDAPNHHINVKSMNVGHINGLPFDFNGLKRGIDISSLVVGGTGNAIPSGVQLYLPRGAGSGANRYIIPSGIVGTGTQFATLNPTGGRGGGVIRIEKLCNSGSNFEIRTPTGTVLHAFPSGTKGWADFMFEKSSAAASGGAVFQLGGHADMF